jgi:tetratricopeptide (TPR) repeat protein
MKIFILLSSLVFTIQFAHAQIDRETAISPKAELKLADLLYAQGYYYSAIQYYTEVIKEKPEWRYSKYWLAMSYLKAKDYKNAELWFKKFKEYRLGPNDKINKISKIEKENRLIFNKVNFYYGQALKHNEKYGEAISQFKAFKGEFVQNGKESKNKDDIDWRDRANVEIKGAEYAINNIGRTVKVKVENLGSKINTAYEEASPAPLNDSIMYYSSLNKERLVYVDKVKDIPPYNIFKSKKVDGEWQKGKLMPSSLNDEKYSTGNVAISEDGNRMYFCKCLKNKVDEVICTINFSQKEGNKWSEGVALNSQINDPNFTSTQPSVRSSGDNWDLIYFVSDRDGGKGGMDIWYFVRTKRGDLKGPRLLKGPINTQFDELTPFYNASDSSFYFSSNGHPGYGGMDIFVSTEDDEMQWIEPINVGAPLNSSADDLYYRRQANSTSGYLVSNRDGTTLINKRYRGDDLYSFRDFVYGLEGFVVKNENEKSGKTIIELSTVRLYTTNLEGKELLVEEVVIKNGEYFFDLKPDKDYKIEVVKPGFSSTFEYVSTKNMLKEDTITKDLSMFKTQIVATGSLFNDSDSLKSRKLDGALVTLVEKMADGTEKEIIAVKLSSMKPTFYFDLDLLKNYAIKVTKDGYFANSRDIDFTSLSANQDTIFSNAMISKIEVGKAYSLENILYEFGKADLTVASEKILDGLAEIMHENPLIIVELSAHTDAVGSDEANFKLSQARAQSCVDYLIKSGLSESRLVAKGYGESMPKAVNDNEDGSDNEEGRALNRRTEFKIIGGLE